MARKPNYAFERRMREKNRAAKKQARLEAKRARRQAESGEPDAEGAEEGEATEGNASVAPAPAEDPIN